MKRCTSAGRTLALACTLALCGNAAHAQDDDAGQQSALKTVRKEIGAAYDEAKRACAGGAAAERSACLQAARQTWQQDMKNAPSQVAAARDMGSVTTTTTRTTGSVSTTTTRIDSAKTGSATDSAASH